MHFFWVKTLPERQGSIAQKKTLKSPSGIPYEYKKYEQKTIGKNLIETVLSIHRST